MKKMFSLLPALLIVAGCGASDGIEGEPGIQDVGEADTTVGERKQELNVVYPTCKHSTGSRSYSVQCKNMGIAIFTSVHPCVTCTDGGTRCGPWVAIKQFWYDQGSAVFCPVGQGISDKWDEFGF